MRTLEKPRVLACFGIVCPYLTPTSFFGASQTGTGAGASPSSSDFFILSESFKKVLHPISALPVHRFRHIRIAIQGEGCRVAARVLLDYLCVISRPKGVYDVGAPAIMEVMRFQPGLHQNLLELLPDRRLRKMTSARMSENQIRNLLTSQARPATSF